MSLLDRPAAPTADPLDVVRQALETHGCAPQPTAKGYKALCPAHDDQRPSLDVARGTRQPVVMTCRANCPTDQVLAAIGLKPSELCEPTTREEPVTYDYTDAAGNLLYQKVRKPGKEFRQRRPDGAGGWVWSLGDTPRVLYRLPQVLEAIAAGHLVWLTEGEKDADTLQARLPAGEVATTMSDGAGVNKWRTVYTDTLADAVVMIVADRDPQGLDHARGVGALLEHAGATVTLVQPRTGKDAHDHLVAGLTPDDFDPLTDPAEHREDPIPGTQPEDLADFLAIDLDDFLAGGDEPYRWVIPGVAEEADRIIITGPEGGGKSTLLRQVAVQAAGGIHPFTGDPMDPVSTLIVDCENSERQVRRKIRPLRDELGNAYTPGTLRLHVVGHALDLARPEVFNAVALKVHAQQPRLIIIGPIYKLTDGDPVKEEPARALADALDRLRQISGAVLLIEAHTPYSDGGKSRRPIRPYGASLWSRWPEFGIYLAPDGDLEHWRGPRDERDWPRRLHRAQPWPWAVIDTPDEPEEWNGPVNCMTAIEAWFEQNPTTEMSKSAMATQLRAEGGSWRERTVHDALAILARQGRIAHRKGARNADLYRYRTEELLDAI